MNENKKVFFIINKFSGTGYQDSVEGKIIDFCQQQNWEHKIEFTKAIGHAAQLAIQAINERFSLVAAAGGDGTINEVSQALLNTPVPLAILPKGSGNGLARHLGIPLSFTKALATLTSSTVVAMDTFTVNGLMSVNVSGIGFDGHIASLFGKNGNRGLFGYAQLTVREFLRYQEFSGEITLDGHRLADTKNFLIAIANSSQFGNNARIAPHASACDGWLDVCLVKKMPLHQTPRFAQQLFSGKLSRSHFVRLQNARQITMKFHTPVAYHIDGEPQQPAQEFFIQIKPASLKMLVPASTHEL